ncbi:MAG: ribosomal protein S18-alanine N-acetyltransferase [Acidobacteriota bacterium]|nr:ribosomal protein S18-alanine N-acetyltransferase [Acidobacteriota bacterium]
MTLKLRPATADDLPALLEIEQNSFASANWLAEDFLKYRCTVAEMHGRVAGFVVIRETYPGGSNELAESEILNLAVAPAFRRLGIATALLRSTLLHSLIYFLEVRESNVPAQALYLKLGFKEIGRRKAYYQHPVETAIVMQMR